MNRIAALLLAVALMLFLAACSVAEPSLGELETLSTPAFGTTARGVTPEAIDGNFVSSSDDDQVCYDLGLGDGLEVRGIKVDPPIGYSDAFVTTTISADGRYLEWVATDAAVLAFIIKGGPRYHLYDYDTVYADDQGLVSPMQGKRIPQISHYNFCYEPLVINEVDQGCTPGYWRNHLDRWEEVAPADDFDATFGVGLFSPDITLGTAISLGGGGLNAFARHATAALLNAYGGVPNADGTYVSYPYSPAEVIAMVQAAADSGDFEAAKDVFQAANELGCPLNNSTE
jgi:hypothetical protein